MDSNEDYMLAKLIAEKLKGRFWEITAGEWWVVVEGMSRQRLVIWTNDPFGITFTPKELTISLAELKEKTLSFLVQEGVVQEDGSWRHLASA
jgi:hypothetical protein